LRQSILRLMLQGHPIASSNHDPLGFFYFIRTSEVRRYLTTLKSRQRELTERIAAFERASRFILYS
jgi:hypothetical protein